MWPVRLERVMHRPTPATTLSGGGSTARTVSLFIAVTGSSIHGLAPGRRKLLPHIREQDCELSCTTDTAVLHSWERQSSSYGDTLITSLTYEAEDTY